MPTKFYKILRININNTCTRIEKFYVTDQYNP